MNRSNLPLDAVVVVLHPIAHRVPVCGDVYVASTGKLLRCKGKNYSKHAKRKFIVMSWRGGENATAKIVHSTNVSEGGNAANV